MIVGAKTRKRTLALRVQANESSTMDDKTSLDRIMKPVNLAFTDAFSISTVPVLPFRFSVGVPPMAAPRGASMNEDTRSTIFVSCAKDMPDRWWDKRTCRGGRSVGRPVEVGNGWQLFRERIDDHCLVFGGDPSHHAVALGKWKQEFVSLWPGKPSTWVSPPFGQFWQVAGTFNINGSCFSDRSGGVDCIFHEKLKLKLQFYRVLSSDGKMVPWVGGHYSPFHVSGENHWDLFSTTGGETYTPLSTGQSMLHGAGGDLAWIWSKSCLCKSGWFICTD